MLKVKGFHFSIEEGLEAQMKNALLTAGIETNYNCNLECVYCAWGSNSNANKTIDFYFLKYFIDNVKKLGAKSITIIGGGEPTLYYKFKELINYINKNELIPILITNGLTLTDETIKFLYEANCSIFIKSDSFKQNVQDYLSGTINSFKEINSNLVKLMNYGFNQKLSNNLTRLGISIVVNRKNFKEIEDLWCFARENNIFPNLEILNTSCGRALVNQHELKIPEDELNKLFKRLNEIDTNKYYIPKPDKYNNPCQRHIYSLYLNVDGWIQPCSALKEKSFNIKDQNFNDLFESEYYKKLKFNNNCMINHSAQAIFSSTGD